MELLPRIRRQPMVLTQGVDLGKQENELIGCFLQLARVY